MVLAHFPLVLDPREQLFLSGEARLRALLLLGFLNGDPRMRALLRSSREHWSFLSGDPRIWALLSLSLLLCESRKHRSPPKGSLLSTTSHFRLLSAEGGECSL